MPSNNEVKKLSVDYPEIPSDGRSDVQSPRVVVVEHKKRMKKCIIIFTCMLIAVFVVGLVIVL